jgi:adenylate cyclase class 2
MPTEVEVKFRVEDPEALAGRLRDHGAVEGAEEIQSDLYLAHPARDFARTGEAFRLRRDGERNYLTYKGPRQPGPTKTREEIEVPIAPGEDGRAAMSALLDRLGFRPVKEIRKHRRTFQRTVSERPMTVVLDRVEGLGDFAEVEALSRGDEDLPAAQQAVLDLARDLGLTVIEPRSYLRMALEAGAPG